MGRRRSNMPDAALYFISNVWNNLNCTSVVFTRTFIVDYILIDCMPSLGMVTINALAASDSVLIPVQASYLPIKGLEQLIKTIRKVRVKINPELQIEGILLTMVDERTNYAREIISLLEEGYGHNIHLFKSRIPHSVRGAEISAVGMSIYEYDGSGRVAKAYESLVEEVLANA